MMKFCKLFPLLAAPLLFSQCTSTAPTGSSSPTPSILEVSQILDSIDSAFYYFANQTGGNAQQAIELAAGWVASRPNVKSAQALDSTYVLITLKSGLSTSYYFDELDSSGLSIFRGGRPSAKSEPSLVATIPKSKNTITNKNVLIWAAAYSEFYGPNELQPIINRINTAGLDLTITLMKDATCTYSTVDQFANYGLVIMDTHGEPDGFLLGTVLPLTDLDSTASHLQQTMTATIGADGYAKILSGQLGIMGQKSVITLTPNWWKAEKPILKKLWMSSKYLASIPSLSSTVVFGNMCYSGWQVATPSGNPAIGTTFMAQNPISYYSFSFDNGKSGPVDDRFSKQMEDSLTQQFFVNLDSTGNASLAANNSLYYDKNSYYARDPDGKLWFKQSGPLDYSYVGCVTSFTDNRDGQVYKAVCIGNQNWMAQNLNYDAPGSYCYDSVSGNCGTYGRLYPWTVAMGGASATNANPSGVRGICPNGWHIPSYAEWMTLLTALGGPSVAGGALKSTSSLWSQPNAGATNSTGFSALPGGYFGWQNLSTPTVLFSGLGDLALFHSASLSPSDTTVAMLSVQTTFGGVIFPFKAYDNIDPYQPPGNAACRCVKDP